ncbi:hypothetical protein Tco_1475599 [Tanacetum coccineum]
MAEQRDKSLSSLASVASLHISETKVWVNLIAGKTPALTPGFRMALTASFAVDNLMSCVTVFYASDLSNLIEVWLALNWCSSYFSERHRGIVELPPLSKELLFFIAPSPMTAPKKSIVGTPIFIFVGDKTKPLSSQIFSILYKCFACSFSFFEKTSI